MELTMAPNSLDIVRNFLIMHQNCGQTSHTSDFHFASHDDIYRLSGMDETSRELIAH